MKTKRAGCPNTQIILFMYQIWNKIRTYQESEYFRILTNLAANPASKSQNFTNSTYNTKYNQHKEIEFIVTCTSCFWPLIAKTCCFSISVHQGLPFKADAANKLIWTSVPCHMREANFFLPDNFWVNRHVRSPLKYQTYLFSFKIADRFLRCGS